MHTKDQRPLARASIKVNRVVTKQVVAALSRLGFVEVHRKGSHVKMKHADGRVIIFPYHDEVDRYTLKGALRDADVDLEAFLKEV